MPTEEFTPAALVTEVLELARSRSLVRDQFDWEALVLEFGEKSAVCEGFADAHALIRELLDRLGDGHSFLRTPSDMASVKAEGRSGLRVHQEEPVVIDVFQGSPGARAGVRVGDRIAAVEGEGVTAENWRRLRRQVLRSGTRLELEGAKGREVSLSGDFALSNPLPQGRMMAPDVGLLDLPGHDGDGTLGDGLEYGAVVRELPLEQEEAGARGWIVDLRRCDGGNMWPMLAGLTPLLGVGRYGSFVDPVGSSWLDWGFDGRVLQVISRADPSELYIMAEVPDRELPRLDGAPVALLTSGVTSSSGEAVLISFVGRQDTRTFGLPTGGLTTSNNLHVLADGSWLLLAENLEADRHGNAYRDRITPDEVIEIDWRYFGEKADRVVRVAVSWLLSSSEDVAESWPIG